MPFKSYIVKSWVTSIIGTLLMLSSLFLWFFGIIPLIWDGVVGLVLGSILLMSPKTIEPLVGKAIQAWGRKNIVNQTEDPTTTGEGNQKP